MKSGICRNQNPKQGVPPSQKGCLRAWEQPRQQRWVRRTRKFENLVMAVSARKPLTHRLPDEDCPQTLVGSEPQGRSSGPLKRDGN